MNDDGLGLIITDDHGATLATSEPSPVSFRVTDISSLPPQWMSEIPARNQGSFSCCVGGGLSGCFEHRNLVEVGEFQRWSMWMAYISAQRASNMLGRDSGASLAGALKAANAVGVCLDSLCPMPSGYTTKIPQAAFDDAGQHKHLDSSSWDCREWAAAIDHATNKDPILIGTVWTSEHSKINATNWIEHPKTFTSGTRRGYHCRYVCGWTTINGELALLIRNTHGTKYGRNGVSVLPQESFEVLRRDPNFVSLRFRDIAEREPKRRSFLESKSGDEC